LSLEQLILNCKKNDAKAQSQLYKLFSSKLFSICLKYSRNRAEAQDTLHDTFIIVFKKIGQYKHKGSFEGWLKRVTVTTALQKFRNKGVLDIVNEEHIEDVSLDIDEEQVSLDFLLTIIQELPDRYRLVFNLYVLDGFSHNEVSEMLSISAGTSKSNLARARNILKQKIETYLATLKSQSL
jgi:RNA polymerase sigma-70 factor (ECF subfamily)